MVENIPEYTPETIKAEDLIGVYTRNDENIMTSEDGREFELCIHGGAGFSRKAPKYYLANKAGYVSGLFYVRQNHYSLSAKSDGVKLSMFIEPDILSELNAIEPLF